MKKQRVVLFSIEKTGTGGEELWMSLHEARRFKQIDHGGGDVGKLKNEGRPSQVAEKLIKIWRLATSADCQVTLAGFYADEQLARLFSIMESLGEDTSHYACIDIKKQCEIVFPGKQVTLRFLAERTGTLFGDLGPEERLAALAAAFKKLLKAQRKASKKMKGKTF